MVASGARNLHRETSPVVSCGSSFIRDGEVSRESIACTSGASVPQGFTYAYNPTLPIGGRVDASSIKLAGSLVMPDQGYRITVNAFLADGGDGFAILKSGTSRTAGGLDLDALVAYLTAHSPVAPPAQKRVTKL